MGLSCAKGATRMSKVWIGTSGWTYDGWRGPFYPTDLTKTKWLCWYASQFPTTEINGSFYRTLTEGSSGVARPNPKGFSFRVEGVEVHHPLEAAERE